MQLVTIASGLLGVALCLASLRELWRARERGAIVAVAPLVFASSIVVNQSWLATRVVILGTGLITIAASLGCAYIYRGSIAHVRIPFRAVLFLLVPAWMFVVDATASAEAGLIDTFGRLLPLAALSSLVPLCAARGTSFSDLTQTVLFAIGFASILSFFAPAPWQPCSIFKCGPFGELYVGAFESENYLGALGAYAVILGFAQRGRTTAWLCGGLGVLLLLSTASRTSQLAAVVGVLTYLLIARYIPMSTTAVRRLVAYSVTAVLTGVGLWLVYRSDSASFSNRGGIWKLGVDAVGSDWLTGRGLSTWSTDVLARNYMHSQALLLLYGGGLIAIALYCWAVAESLSVPSKTASAVAAATGVVVLTRGLTELSWNPLSLDGTTLFILPLFFAACVGSHSDPLASTAWRGKPRVVAGRDSKEGHTTAGRRGSASR